MSGGWKSSFSLGSVLVAVGLTAGTVYIMRIDGAEVGRIVAQNTQNTAVAEARGNSMFVRAGYQATTGFGKDEKYYGYYGDLDNDGKTTNISKETLTLRFAKDAPEVAGEISGPAPYEGKLVPRTWKVQGLSRNNELVLGIVTVQNPQDPKPPSGLGTYYLRQADGDDFTGTAIYLDCIHKFVQCPYALARADISPEEAKRRWPALLSRACEKIDLTPDVQTAPASC